MATNAADQQSKTGNGVDIDFSNPANLADDRFFLGLAKIREVSPVYWSDLQQGWIITGFDELTASFRDRRLSAKRLHINQFRSIDEDERAALIPNMARYVPDWVINVDGEQHARLRRLVNKAFNRKIVENLRADVAALVDEILDKIDQQASVEFIEEVAFCLPATLIMRLLGLSHSTYDDLRRWARDVTFALASQSPPRELLLSAEQCFVEMNAVFEAELEKRKINPTPDLITELMMARDEHDALTSEELVGICHVVLLAGHDTTANSLGLGLLALHRNPQQRKQYLADPGNAMTHMTEIMRISAMSSAQVRIVAEPFELAGKQLEAGQIVFLMIAAGNRDPKVYDDPNAMILDRDPSRSLTFGPGLHHCVGHLLARMQLDVFFRAFFARYREFEVLDEHLVFTPNYAFRGLEHLNIRLEKR